MEWETEHQKTEFGQCFNVKDIRIDKVQSVALNDLRHINDVGNSVFTVKSKYTHSVHYYSVRKVYFYNPTLIREEIINSQIKVNQEFWDIAKKLHDLTGKLLDSFQ